MAKSIPKTIPTRRRAARIARGRAGPLTRFLFLSLIGPACASLRADPPPAGPEPGVPRYEWRAEHDPEGTGKFYMGREIAQVMGHEWAEWLERPQREEEERPGLLIERLRLKPGDVVADIGSGTGYFTRRLAGKVGPAGKVFAVDVQVRMIELLQTNMAALGITNVISIRGTAVGPRLPDGSVDLVLMVDVYHEFDFPYEMMTAICRALKPEGRVVFVEYRLEDPSVPIKLLHKMAEAQVKKEMSVFPLAWMTTIEVLPRQHIIVFRNVPHP
ncbi:MAG: class I SAM-dependent methyltransferase [Limisphaerales bacterium]